MAFAGGFSKLGYYFQAYGIMDFLLPFLLVFTIIYAVMQKTQILGDKKNFNVIIALVIALLFVVPHLMGYYPLGYDPVQVMNESIPSIALVAVAAIMLLILMGIFGTDFTSAMAPVIAIASLGFVVYIFGSALNFWVGPSDVFYWWTSEVTELMIILLVFGVIVWFVVKEPKKPGDKTAFGRIGDVLGKLAEKR
ncbi:hypothetical protein HOE37_06255 [Candidatus Woesearchaeota archaeon]|jgi:hypothetical protein|nr:hypothetical protein [Candidatus Woesearchaeota archaeon]MBT4111433.1 hypothetical protein [Candidatus Woesearchaeota archaeon]MBT4336362.1 hypothetical protein [Candidatus Woesearchaeota archaeon]MBT4469983.1 hypothetical protein [Candidatus Woesearchaeota archaeon]MBT6744293.1 hypothetical protein [Candidatus Woesearchaeota archaeon]